MSDKFGTGTVSVNGTLVEAKKRTFTLESSHFECALFSFNKCPIYTHDGASAKFSTNSHETGYSASYKMGPGDAHCYMFFFI